MTRLGVSAALVDREVVRGDVDIDDGVIAAVGAMPAGRGGVAVPGFIDLQVNGFGGVDFLTTDLDGYRRAGDALLATGVTSYQPTLVSSAEKVVLEAMDTIAAAPDQAQPRVLGIHLEGPFIDPAFKGAHDERYIVAPDLAYAERLCANGHVTTMTIAPEQPGGWDLLDWLVRHGVIVSIGHSGADAAAAHEAFNRGARWVTHLHNAQRRFAARDPGIAAVAMTRGDVTIGLIADLVHLASETVLLAFLAARDRVTIVTDAIAAAPSAEGQFTLGDRPIVVSDGAARLADGTLAGSVLSMDRAVRNLVHIGIPWSVAVNAATALPARMIGRPELGTLRPGTPADIVVLDDALGVTQTIAAGQVAWAA